MSEPTDMGLEEYADLSNMATDHAVTMRRRLLQS